MARAMIVLTLLMLGGCMSNVTPESDLATTASPKRYETDPIDKPKRVCESTMEGNEPKTICY